MFCFDSWNILLCTVFVEKRTAYLNSPNSNQIANRVFELLHRRTSCALLHGDGNVLAICYSSMFLSNKGISGHETSMRWVAGEVFTLADLTKAIFTIPQSNMKLSCGIRRNLQWLIKNSITHESLSRDILTFIKITLVPPPMLLQ